MWLYRLNGETWKNGEPPPPPTHTALSGSFVAVFPPLTGSCVFCCAGVLTSCASATASLHNGHAAQGSPCLTSRDGVLLLQLGDCEMVCRGSCKPAYRTTNSWFCSLCRRVDTHTRTHIYTHRPQHTQATDRFSERKHKQANSQLPLSSSAICQLGVAGVLPFHDEDPFTNPYCTVTRRGIFQHYTQVLEHPMNAHMDQQPAP